MTQGDGGGAESGIAPNGGALGRPVTDGMGKWIKGVASVARDAEAFRLRSRGWTLRKISDELGYGGEGNVHRALRLAQERNISPAVDEYRLTMDRHLDELAAEAMAVLEAKHYKVNNGVLVRDDLDDGQGVRPLEDDAPVLKAIDALLKIAERRAKLWGLDAPVKSEIGLRTIHYTVDGVNMDQV